MMTRITDQQRQKLAARLAKPNSTDTGEMVPAVAAAWKLPSHDPARLPTLVEALRGQRLLLPMYPHPHGQSEPDLAASLQTVALQYGNGVWAFPSLRQLREYDPQARPFPVPVRQIATWAASAFLPLVLDAEKTTIIPVPALEALAANDDWLCPENDPRVQKTLAHFAEKYSEILSIQPRTRGEELILQVTVRLEDTARARRQVAELAQQIPDIAALAALRLPLRIEVGSAYSA